MKPVTKRIILAITLGLVAVGLYAYYKKGKNKTEQTDNGDDNQGGGRSIIIGDSQTPYIAKQSSKVKMLGTKGGESVLWQGGQNLAWLKNAVSKYPVTNDVSNVVINIGTNGGFNQNDDTSGLVTEVKRVFPKARLFAVIGSWGWGGNKNKTEKQVRAYYDNFAKLGVTIVEPPIGAIEPHGDKPVYKQIGKNLDSLIK